MVSISRWFRYIPLSFFQKHPLFTVVFTLLILAFNGRAQKSIREHYRAIDQQIRLATLSRTLARTERGYMGLFHHMVRPRDSIVLVKGGRLPLILRPHDGENWKLIGDGYVCGIMHGEVFDKSKSEEIRIQ